MFDSAYTKGGIVAAAGTVLIRNDGGHYPPRESHMARVISALDMYGVPLMPIELRAFTPGAEVLGNALDFVRSRMTWWQFTEAARNFKDPRGARPVRNAVQPARLASAPPLARAEHNEEFANQVRLSRQA